MDVSAYIPCFNSEATIAEAIESIAKQSRAVSELFVVDDASTDRSRDVARSLGVRVVQLDRRGGRGAVRARAMFEAKCELVLSCDSSKRLCPDFVERATGLFADSSVAAIFGRIVQDEAKTAAGRWFARHALGAGSGDEIKHHASLNTAAAIVRRQVVLDVGNFDGRLRQSEDRELGDRLIANGYDVVADPGLIVTMRECSGVHSALERFWRWHAGARPAVSPVAYLKQILYALKVMARADIADSDLAGLAISLTSPHYQLLRTMVADVQGRLPPAAAGARRKN